MVDAYNNGPGKKDGFSVKRLLFSRQGYFEKELADMAARSSQFDLALVTTYTLGKYAPYLSPIDQFVSKGLAAKFFPVALQSLTSGADSGLVGAALWAEACSQSSSMA